MLKIPQFRIINAVAPASGTKQFIQKKADYAEEAVRWRLWRLSQCCGSLRQHNEVIHPTRRPDRTEGKQLRELPRQAVHAAAPDQPVPATGASSALLSKASTIRSS